MTFNEYQKQAKKTEMMQRVETPLASDPAFVAKILGLAGETGEIAEKFKKIIRDKDGAISKDDANEIRKELGDVLWYVSAISDYMGIPLEEVAAKNLEKVFSRKTRGVQHGSGDNR